MWAVRVLGWMFSITCLTVGVIWLFNPYLGERVAGAIIGIGGLGVMLGGLGFIILSPIIIVCVIATIVIAMGVKIGNRG